MSGVPENELKSFYVMGLKLWNCGLWVASNDESGGLQGLGILSVILEGRGMCIKMNHRE